MYFGLLNVVKYYEEYSKSVDKTITMCYYTHKLYIQHPSRKNNRRGLPPKKRRNTMTSSFSPTIPAMSYDRFIEALFTYCNYERLVEESESKNLGRIKESKDFYGHRVLNYLNGIAKQSETTDQLADKLACIL